MRRKITNSFRTIQSRIVKTMNSTSARKRPLSPNIQNEDVSPKKVKRVKSVRALEKLTRPVATKRGDATEHWYCYTLASHNCERTYVGKTNKLWFILVIRSYSFATIIVSNQ